MPERGLGGKRNFCLKISIGFFLSCFKQKREVRVSPALCGKFIPQSGKDLLALGIPPVLCSLLSGWDISAKGGISLFPGGRGLPAFDGARGDEGPGEWEQSIAL